jgi:hypothetical protein
VFITANMQRSGLCGLCGLFASRAFFVAATVIKPSPRGREISFTWGLAVKDARKIFDMVTVMVTEFSPHTFIHTRMNASRSALKKHSYLRISEHLVFAAYTFETGASQGIF